jgi:hypothetical protein
MTITYEGSLSGFDNISGIPLPSIPLVVLSSASSGWPVHVARCVPRGTQNRGTNMSQVLDIQIVRSTSKFYVVCMTYLRTVRCIYIELNIKCLMH